MIGRMRNEKGAVTVVIRYYRLWGWDGEGEAVVSILYIIGFRGGVAGGEGVVTVVIRYDRLVAFGDGMGGGGGAEG